MMRTGHSLDGERERVLDHCLALVNDKNLPMDLPIRAQLDEDSVVALQKYWFSTEHDRSLPARSTMALCVELGCQTAARGGSMTEPSRIEPSKEQLASGLGWAREFNGAMLSDFTIHVMRNPARPTCNPLIGYYSLPYTKIGIDEGRPLPLPQPPMLWALHACCCSYTLSYSARSLYRSQDARVPRRWNSREAFLNPLCTIPALLFAIHSH